MITNILLSSLLAVTSPVAVATPVSILPQITANSGRRGKVIRIICFVTRGKARFC